jgi:hypothetical protein
MKELEKRIAKANSEIASAERRKERQQKRIKIKRSYKGDTTIDEASLKITTDGITTSERVRMGLVEQIRTLNADKK